MANEERFWCRTGAQYGAAARGDRRTPKLIGGLQTYPRAGLYAKPQTQYYMSRRRIRFGTMVDLVEVIQVEISMLVHIRLLVHDLVARL